MSVGQKVFDQITWNQKENEERKNNSIKNSQFRNIGQQNNYQNINLKIKLVGNSKKHF